MSHPHAPNLDPLAILNALGVGRPGAVEPVTGGADTDLWRVTHGGATYALRVFRLGEQENAAREAVVMQAVRAGGLPVPEIVEQAEWSDRPVHLLTWCSGMTVAASIRRRVWEARHLGTLFGEVQAALHRLPLPSVLRDPRYSWLRWRGVAADLGLEVTLEQRSSEERLLHLDFHALNVMTDGRRITGILDWTNARAGDPRADLARTLTIFRLDNGSIGRPPWQTGPVDVVSRLFVAGWWNAYTATAGPVSGMAPFYAWAGTLMERDLDMRYPPEHLRHIVHWTERWRKSAGL